MFIWLCLRENSRNSQFLWDVLDLVCLLLVKLHFCVYMVKDAEVSVGYKQKGCRKDIFGTLGRFP